jgi:hypothetical protein
MVSGPASLGGHPSRPIIQALLALICGGCAEQQDVALCGLDCVADTDACLEAIVSNDEIISLVVLVRDGSGRQKGHTAFVLVRMSTIENSLKAIVAVGGVSALAELVRSGSRERKASAALAFQSLSRTLLRLAVPATPATSWWSHLCEHLHAAGRRALRRGEVTVLSHEIVLVPCSS